MYGVRGAYLSLEAAEVEVQHRFGEKRWRLLRSTYVGVKQAADTEGSGWNAFVAGVALAAKTLPPLGQAAKALRKAEQRAKAALAKWEPHFGLEALELPDSFLTLAGQAAAVERAADETRAFVETAKGTAKRWDLRVGKVWLVRAAAKRGIRGRAADWCLAFIALRLDDKIEQSPDAPDEWRKRWRAFRKEAKDAGLPVRAGVGTRRS